MKSDGRIEQEKAIMNKIQSIFDNAEYIQEIDIAVHAARDCLTTIKYTVEETIIPKGAE